jgi:hypothetical protein
MRIESLAIKLRNTTPWAAADMGIGLCRMHAKQLYACLWPLMLPLSLLALACYELAHWLPLLLLWWFKPWLDRTLLFVLSRAAFGQHTGFADVWHAQRDVWWQQLFSTFTLRRLSPWRALTQPVYQLEGNDWRARRKRVLQIRRGNSGTAMLVSSAFGFAELSFLLSLLFLAAMLTPSDQDFQLFRWLFKDGAAAPQGQYAMIGGYSLVILLLEPFYVASGFGMYLNRRVTLEAWDIEQELRHARAA